MVTPMISMIFATERLLIRELRTDDLPGFHELQNNPQVMRYTGESAATWAQNRQELADCIAKYSQPQNDFWIWAVVIKSDEQFAGTCAIVNEQHELGYRLLERFWQQGFGRELSDGLLQHAFDTMRLEQAFAVVDRDNVASVKILESSALQFVGESFNAAEDCFDRRYELTIEQWRARTG